MRKIGIITLILSICLTFGGVLAAETGTLEEYELNAAQTQFAVGKFSDKTKVSVVRSVSDDTFYNGSYTRMYNLTSTSAKNDANFGTVEAVNSRIDSEGNLKTIGIENEALSGFRLALKVKLDDVRNKNLKVAFSYIEGEDGMPDLDAGYHNNADKIRKLATEDGEAYIPFGEFLEETTDWQTVEFDLPDLAAYSKLIDAEGEICGDADWTKASAIHIASINTDNAFSDTENPAENIEILYGDIKLIYYGKLVCDVQISLTDGNSEIGTINNGDTVIPKVRMLNAMSKDRTALAMAAVYVDGVMTSLIPKTLTAPKQTATEGADFYLDAITVTDAAKTEIIVYLWTDYTGMRAITNQVSAGR